MTSPETPLAPGLAQVHLEVAKIDVRVRVVVIEGLVVDLVPAGVVDEPQRLTGTLVLALAVGASPPTRAGAGLSWTSPATSKAVALSSA